MGREKFWEVFIYIGGGDVCVRVPCVGGRGGWHRQNYETKFVLPYFLKDMKYGKYASFLCSIHKCSTAKTKTVIWLVLLPMLLHKTI